MNKTTPTFLTTEELAKRWKMNANTLRNLRFRGQGPTYFKPTGTPGGRVLYRLEDVEAWEKQNMVD